MAILAQAPIDEVDGPSARHRCRKHLQRLIRKVQHVLVVKHWIDDLRQEASQGRERSLGNASTPKELSKSPTILPEINDGLKTAAKYLASGPTSSPLPLNDVNAKLTLKHLLRAPISNGGLHNLESFLDTYIVHSYDWVRRCQQRIGSASRRAWKNWDKKRAHVATKISWAKKRSSSVKDNRSLTLLVKLLGTAEQFYILQGYLDAYFAGSYGNARETLSEVVSRLRAVFGVGWFFEWPSGRHPLNSTWPWADVKPSLLVLWGVCWMFFPDYGNPHIGQQYRQQNTPLHHNTYHQMQNTRIQPQNFTQPINLGDPGHGLLPSTRNLVRIPRQTQPIMQGFPHSTSDYYGRLVVVGTHTHGQMINTSSHSEPVQSSRVSLPDNGDDWYLRSGHPGSSTVTVRNREASSNVARDLSADWPRHRVLDPALGENQIFSPQATSIHRCQRQQHIRTFRNSLYSELTDPAYTTPMPMPSSSTFNYPPLDTMGELQDSRAYMDQERVYTDMDQERAYNQIPVPGPHEYEHADHQQEQPRYPSPPPPLSENPYNAQQPTETPDSRIDIPVDPKSESDAPSPGRSKPVPKPDREVTKDANGRFYCNWPNCTEEQRDFGRKCEWSKHMDKHDRPYKCPAEGCEKLPGFTYSGGLLRHEREVHNKHGGPRKQLNCPHLNCKRHTGKGFSRQENLNEHLRRVHTDAGPVPNGEETEEDGGDALAGGKRKRVRADSQDLREEMKRLRQENEELRRQAEAQNRQSAEMMHQILQLQASMRHPSMQAPPAQMT